MVLYWYLKSTKQVRKGDPMANRVLEQDKLAYSVKVSLNQADYDMLAAEAKDTGLSVATVARICLTEILPIVRKRGRDKRSIARVRSKAKGTT